MDKSRKALALAVGAALMVAGCGSAPGQRAVSVKAVGAGSPATPTTSLTTVAGQTKWTGVYSAVADHVGSDYSWLTPIVVSTQPQRMVASLNPVGDVQLGPTTFGLVQVSGGWQVKVGWTVQNYSTGASVEVTNVEADAQIPGGGS